ncbi:MAG: hypothetical protein ACRC46_02780 [Thermoguttaceae bacterium]
MWQSLLFGQSQVVESSVVLTLDVPRVVFLLLAVLVLAFAGGLWGRFEERWRTLPEGHPSWGYGRRRYRRYMQLRVLAGLASVGMFVGLLISPRVHGVIFLASWLGVIFFLLWVVVLGLMMALEARVHFLRELNRQQGDEQVIRRAIRRELGRDTSTQTSPSRDGA